jgi:ribosomal protein L7/L12
MNAFTLLIVILALVVILLLAANISNARRVQGLRVRGLYPEEGKEKDDDVLRLLKAGEKIMAIKCYRELHGLGIKKAKEAVELIERNSN